MIKLIEIFYLFVAHATASRLTSNYKEDCVFGTVVNSSQYRRLKSLFNIGPKKGVHYNPNYGYEPYWPGGDWVFDRYDTTTQKRPGMMCGEECPEMYKMFGHVCGRNKHYAHKTFDNYCELFNEDCTLRQKWIIAYRGKCQKELKTYPTKSRDMATRAMKYISDFVENNPSTIRFRRGDGMIIH